jgi:hypothetical protein
MRPLSDHPQRKQQTNQFLQFVQKHVDLHSGGTARLQLVLLLLLLDQYRRLAPEWLLLLDTLATSSTVPVSSVHVDEELPAIVAAQGRLREEVQPRQLSQEHIVPVAGTSGVATKAAATAELDRSWNITSSPSSPSSSPLPELHQYCPANTLNISNCVEHSS